MVETHERNKKVLVSAQLPSSRVTRVDEQLRSRLFYDLRLVLSKYMCAWDHCGGKYGWEGSSLFN